jgi:hypothetical protein
MILPGKHLRGDIALLGVGGEVLAQLSEPKTVSELWERTPAGPSSWFFSNNLRLVHFVTEFPLCRICD